MSSVTDLSLSTVRATHSWKILSASLLATRKRLESDVFHAGGRSWKMLLYTDGDRAEDKGFVSVFLELVKGEKASVQFEVAVVQATGANKAYSVHAELTQSHNYGWYQFIKRDALLEPSAGYCMDDSVTFRLTMAIATSGFCEESSPCTILLDFEQLLASESLSDVIIRVEGQEIAAHKAILGARSPVFRAMFSHHMKESKECIVEINDFDRDVVDTLLQYIYTGHLAPRDEDVKGRISSWDKAQGLFAAADKYGLPRLTELCVPLLKHYLSVDNVIATMRLASQHDSCTGSAALQRVAKEFAMQHAEELIMASATSRAASLSPVALLGENTSTSCSGDASSGSHSEPATVSSSQRKTSGRTGTGGTPPSGGSRSSTHNHNHHSHSQSANGGGSGASTVEEEEEEKEPLAGQHAATATGTGGKHTGANSHSSSKAATTKKGKRKRSLTTTEPEGVKRTGAV